MFLSASEGKLFPSSFSPFPLVFLHRSVAPTYPPPPARITMDSSIKALIVKKFKDADLIGIPLRITIGGKGLQAGVIELKWRAKKDVIKVPVAEAAEHIAAAVRDAFAQA